MFIRSKRQGGREYFYLVENYRENKKVKQRVVRYLGKVAPAPGELRRIMKEVGG